MARDAAILGMTLFNATPDESREIHAGLVAGLENGTLNPVVGKEFPLADAVEGARRGDGVRGVRKDRAGALTVYLVNSWPLTSSFGTGMLTPQDGGPP